MTKQELQAQLDILREVYQDINRLAHLKSTEVIHQLAESVKDELQQSSTTESLAHDYTAASIHVLDDTPTFPSIDSLTSQELKNALDALSELLKWIDKLKAHAVNEILNGNESFGYKIRKGASRTTIKPGVNFDDIVNKSGLSVEDCYETKPVSASKLFKVMTEDQKMAVADYFDIKTNQPSLIKIGE